MLLFANYKTFSIAVDDKGKKRKAQGGERVMYTSHNACWDAKNRFGLPDEVPFDYKVIQSIIEPVSYTHLACDCKIVHEDFTKILTCVLAYFKERNASYYHKISHEGYLRHLLVRRAENTGEILVNLVTTSQEEWDLMPLVQEVLGLPLEGKVVGFLHIINDSLADIVTVSYTHLGDGAVSRVVCDVRGGDAAVRAVCKREHLLVCERLCRGAPGIPGARNRRPVTALCEGYCDGI